VARALARAGAQVTVASRRGASAQRLAARLRQADAAELRAALPAAEVVVCSTGAMEPVLTAAMLRGRRRALTVLDLGLPRDVEPAVESLPGVALVTLDDLSRRVAGSLRGRRGLAEQARALIEAELDGWEGWFRTASVAPTLGAMARYADGIRERELARALRGLRELDPEVSRRLEALSRSLVSKILLHPIAYLRAHPEDTASAALIERIFSGPPE